MTSYHGGKQRIGKVLAEIIYKTSIALEDKDLKIRGYCEPFCGMLGVYRHTLELFEEHKPRLKYKAGDTNKSVILMWKEAQKGWNPDIITTIDKKYFDKLKYSKKDSAIRGFIGHHCAFGGVYFGGFRPERCLKNNIKKVVNKINDIGYDLENVSFTHGDYKQFSNLKGYIIYCDPPYSIYNRYYDTDMNQQYFNHDEFWNWCRKMSKDNIIFISEYKAPDDFILLYSNDTKINHNSITKKNSDNLYII